MPLPVGESRKRLFLRVNESRGRARSPGVGGELGLTRITRLIWPFKAGSGPNCGTQLCAP